MPASEWLYCRDDKYRPIKPGTFPLAHGATARVGRLRGYGNALNAEQAKAFIEAAIECGIGNKAVLTQDNDSYRKGETLEVKE